MRAPGSVAPRRVVGRRSFRPSGRFAFTAYSEARGRPHTWDETRPTLRPTPPAPFSWGPRDVHARGGGDAPRRGRRGGARRAPLPAPPPFRNGLERRLCSGCSAWMAALPRPRALRLRACVAGHGVDAPGMHFHAYRLAATSLAHPDLDGVAQLLGSTPPATPNPILCSVRAVPTRGPASGDRRVAASVAVSGALAREVAAQLIASRPPAARTWTAQH